MVSRTWLESCLQYLHGRFLPTLPAARLTAVTKTTRACFVPFLSVRFRDRAPIVEVAASVEVSGGREATVPGEKKFPVTFPPTHERREGRGEMRDETLAMESTGIFLQLYDRSVDKVTSYFLFPM